MKTCYEFLNRKSNSVKLFLFLLISIGYSSLRTYATIRYVKQTASGLGNGISWANASNNLQAMIEASSDNDEVWVMAGTYKPNSYPTGSGGNGPRDYTFVLKNKVKVYGGFVGTETSLNQRSRSVMVANPSVLSGDLGEIGDNSDNAYHVVISVEDDNTSVLDGFTITKGNANNDDLFKAILIEFRPINPNSGGGRYNSFTSIEIKNCNFIDNKSSFSGGGMYNLKSFTTVTNCVFSANESQNGGGAINIGGELEMTRPGPISFSNCLFSSNSANQGGGMYDDNRDVNITNCSFVNNNSTLDGGAIYVFFFSTTVLNNCIVWGNKKTDGTESNLYCGKNGTCAVNYSDIEGNYSGTGNINIDPRFIDTSDPDGIDNIFATADDGLSIQSNSPCINEGRFRGNPPTDITGFTRFASSDMGAYENRMNMTSVVIGAFPSSISCAGQSITFAAVATIEGETRLYDFKVNGITKQRGASLLFSVNNLANGDSVSVEKIFGDLVFISNTIVVTIKPLPIPNAGSNSPVLIGNTLNFNASNALGGGSYFWTGPNNYSSELQNPSIVNATTQLSGTYTVKVTNNGCEAFSTVQVSVKAQLSRLYVKANAMGANNGTSWANAFMDLQSAFDFPNDDYDEIWVAAGTYKPSKDPSGNFLPSNPRDKTFYLRTSKRLYGGFAGNETDTEQRNKNANPTILSGDIGVVGDNSDNAYHVLISAGFGSGTVLDGFKVTQGNANSSQDYIIEVNGKSIHGNIGGGMVNYESSPAISNCIFSVNSASGEGGGVYNFKGVRIFTNCTFSKNNALSGGGMYNTKSSPDIIACKFIENYAINGGGLMNYALSSPRITHSLFSGNSAGVGGGINNQFSSSPHVINCTLFGNTAKNGGGMYNWKDSSPDLTNYNFSKNSAEMGGGMMIDGTPSTIRNCTFYGNSASYYNGGGIYNLTNGSTSIINSIFWGNTKGFATLGTSSIEGERVAIIYSDVEGGYAGNNINQDPLFVNQNDLDGDDNIFGTSDDGLELKDGSPCINSGAYLDNSIPDITGANRAQQGAFDMGAYESPFTFNYCQTLTWQQGRVTSCDGKATFTIKVNELVRSSIPEYSMDKINWFDASSDNTYTFTVPQQGICRGFYARPKGCNDESKIIWGCYLDTYAGYPVSCEPCSSDLIWIQGGVITCNGKAKMTIKVLGLKANAVAEFSIDQVSWFDATADENTYTFTVPQQGICRSFWARPKGCNNPAKVIWGCYLDTYAGYPVICTEDQIPTVSQPQSLRNYSNEFLMSDLESINVQTLPNPVNDKLTVKIYLPKNMAVKTSLISNTGREIETKNIEGKADENLLTMDLGLFQTGLYFLLVQTVDSRIIKKIIKIQ